MTTVQVAIVQKGIKDGLLSKFAEEGLFDAVTRETGVGLGSGLLGGAGFGLADQLLDPKQKEINAKKLLLSSIASGVGGGMGGALGGGLVNLLGLPATSWQGLALSRVPIVAGSYLASKAVKDGILESDPVRKGHEILQKVSCLR